MIYKHICNSCEITELKLTEHEHNCCDSEHEHTCNTNNSENLNHQEHNESHNAHCCDDERIFIKIIEPFIQSDFNFSNNINIIFLFINNNIFIDLRKNLFPNYTNITFLKLLTSQTLSTISRFIL